MVPCSHELQEPGLAVTTNNQTHKCSFSQTACKGADLLSDCTESPRKLPICLRPREPRYCSFGLVAFSGGGSVCTLLYSAVSGISSMSLFASIRQHGYLPNPGAPLTQGVPRKTGLSGREDSGAV